MNEVSCRIFDVLEGALKAKGLSLAQMAEGTTVPAAKLGSKRDRMDWADFVAVMKNIRRHFTDEEYVAAGRKAMCAPSHRFAAVIARLALGPMDIYRWFNKPKGLGSQLFTCIVPNYSESSANQIAIELTLPEGFEMCWDFFVVVRGNQEALPELFDLPPANVVLTPIPRGGRFQITVPTWRVPLLKRLGRRLTWRSTAQTAARELKEAHESLVEAQSRMGEFSARLQQAEQLSTLAILTSGLAHEIRNPANGITNAIEPLRELLPKEVVAPETGPGQLLGVMSECAEQLSFLSSQLLGFKRDHVFAVSPTDLTQLVQRAIRLAHRALTGVEVRTAFGVKQPVACAGPLLVQALMNLIENAGHAVGAGGWVQVSTKMSGTLVQIEVTDSGKGVPVALRERIFEPFFTTKGAEIGTGLGLPVSRAIVQRHRGVLEIRECNGRPGFVIELPVSESTQAVAQAAV